MEYIYENMDNHTALVEDAYEDLADEAVNIYGEYQYNTVRDVTDEVLNQAYGWLYHDLTTLPDRLHDDLEKLHKRLQDATVVDVKGRLTAIDTINDNLENN